MALADTISSLGTSIINLVNKRAKCDLSNINSDGEDVIRALAGGGAGVPTGTVIAYMGTTIPDGFLLMDGRVLSQETYADLYSVVGVSQLPSGATESSGIYTWTSGGITYSTGAGTDDATHKYKMFAIADMTDGRYLMGSTVAGSRISQCMSETTYALGLKDFFSTASNDNRYSLTNAALGNTNVSTSTVTWSGTGHRVPSSNITMNAPECTKVTWKYGSGNYIRPTSLSCLYLISY